MLLKDLLDPQLLDHMRNERYIRVRQHPHLPLDIYGYAEKAQFDREWNDVTRTCRGLIVHRDTGEVVARPFAKFHNYGEPGQDPIGTGPVEVYDKVDGSLGILYPVPDADGGYEISTRGTFGSPQAEIGTAIYRELYAHRFTPNPAWTYLFEIVAPATRVVLDYKGMRDLVLLAAIDIETGVNIPLDDAATTWPGPVVKRMPYGTLVEALAAPQRENAEGFVVLDPATGNRVKIKQEDYKRLHGIVTGLRKLDVWALLAVEATQHLEVTTAGVRLKMDPSAILKLREHEDGIIGSVASKVPDELYPYVEATIAELRAQAAEAHATIEAHYVALGLGADRKANALAIKDSGHDKFIRSCLMQKMAGHDIAAEVWRSVRPGPFEYVMDEAAKVAAA